MRRVDRRTFLAAGAWLLVVPHATGAQAPRGVHRIGFVSPTGPGPRNEALLRGLRELGYVEGRNLVLERGYAYSDPRKLPALAQTFAAGKVDAIVTTCTPTTRAARAASGAIPIATLAPGAPSARN